MLLSLYHILSPLLELDNIITVILRCIHVRLAACSCFILEIFTCTQRIIFNEHVCVCVSKLLFLQIMFEYGSASPGVTIYFVSLNYQGEKPLDWVKGMWPAFSFSENHIFFILSQSDSSVSSITFGLERPRP